MNFKFEILKRPSCLVKLLEQILASICIGLVMDMPMTLSELQLIHSTFSGFLMVACILIGAMFLDTPVHGVMVMSAAAMGAVMFIIAGVFCIESGPDQLLIAGIVSVCNAVVYIIDIGITFWNFKK